MISQSYLGHDFCYCQEMDNKYHNKYLTFKCSVCNIISYFYSNRDIFTIDDSAQAEKIQFNEDDIMITYKKLIMTCAEIQIKRLLE
jgi:hypothetical protein